MYYLIYNIIIIVKISFLDSSKDSLQSDTSIESEDSFASVIYIPRQDQLFNEKTGSTTIPSVPTSPLVMPCPTPAHSPAPLRCKIQSVVPETIRFTFEDQQIKNINDKVETMKPNNEISPKLEKITKQIVKNLPEIPKFKKYTNFPILRRTSGAPAISNLSAMDIFNPETDDLDSDSSEPSSPDSIDSVISALTSTEQTPVVDTSSNSIKLILSSMHQQQPSDKQQQSVNEIIENSENISRQELVDFAEKLSAQLLKELDEKANKCQESMKTEFIDNINEKATVISLDDPYIKKLNGEIKDLNLLREELRERRLMLANLNVHQYQNNSASSTIQEEDESPRNEMNCNDNEKQASNNLVLVNSTDTTNEINPETNDCNDQEYDFDASNDLTGSLYFMNDESHTNNNQLPYNSYNNVTQNGKNQLQHNSTVPSIESRHSIDSWAHSNSTVSLDSPSGGGSSTHHRYYHVFREGELDSLINHHVTSLHIVNSYYERASWCVVAEKVQVWTI